MFRVNKAKGGRLWIFALLEVSSLLCSKKSFSHRLLKVICGKGGIIWEYQSCGLRDTDGVQSLWCCPDTVGNWLLRADGWIQVEIAPLRIPWLKSVLNTFYSTKSYFSPTDGFSDLGDIVGFFKCLLFAELYPCSLGRFRVST